jgi:hypothetical protein
VITEVGKATERILPENAAALVGAGILSVPLFSAACPFPASTECLARHGSDRRVWDGVIIEVRLSAPAALPSK